MIKTFKTSGRRSVVPAALAVALCLGGLTDATSGNPDEPLIIHSIAQNGEITWSGGNADELVAIQVSPTVTGPWQSTFENRASLIVTSSVGRATVPVPNQPTFYRLRRATALPIADALTESSSSNLHAAALKFLPPQGGGRRERAGIMVKADSAFDAFGSSWEFEFVTNDPLHGVQVIHPYQDGQCIVIIKPDGIGLRTPERWIELGYVLKEVPSSVPLAFTSAYADTFPLKSGKRYPMKTTVSPLGEVFIFTNGALIAKGILRDVHAIDFTIASFENFPGSGPPETRRFEAEDVPLTWQKGFTGILLEPTDASGGGFSAVLNLRYSPGL